MTAWYRQNKRLFDEERAALAASHSDLKLAVLPEGTALNCRHRLRTESAVTKGIYSLQIPENNRRRVEYRISILHPSDYPKSPPIMFGDDPKLPMDDLDRHMISGGQACLAVQTDLIIRWVKAPRIVPFLDRLVAPFLVWQVHFDAFGRPPSWGERSHGAKGILEFYAEALALPVDESTLGFIRLVARKNDPKGHEECPCGSKKRLRYCHRDHILKARQTLSRQAVLTDLSILKGNCVKNS